MGVGAKLINIAVLTGIWFGIGQYYFWAEYSQFQKEYQRISLNLVEHDIKSYIVYQRSPFLDGGCQNSEKMNSCDYMEKWKRIGSCSTYIEEGIECRGVYYWMDNYGYQMTDVYSSSNRFELPFGDGKKSQQDKNYYPRSIVFERWRYNVTLGYVREFRNDTYYIHLDGLSESEKNDLLIQDKNRIQRFIKIDNPKIMMDEGFDYLPSPHLQGLGFILLYLIIPGSLLHLPIE